MPKSPARPAPPAPSSSNSKSEPAIRIRQVEIPRDVQNAISRSLELGRLASKKR